MRISPSDLNMTVTQAQVDELVNGALVTLDDFSRIACMSGRVFGVATACETCEFDLNACARRNLLAQLLQSQYLVEQKVGYTLTPRYIQETIEYNGGLMMTKWPGVAAINVRPLYALLGGVVAVAPYVQTNPAASNTSGSCIVTLSGAVVDNPRSVILRGASGGLYPTIALNGYPRRNGANWEVMLDPSITGASCPEDLQVQHCQHVYVDVDLAACTGGTVVAVYPGTTQEIPFARPVQAMAGNVKRYWFNVWSFVDPAFANESVDLVAGEFYKLDLRVQFACRTEVAAPPTIDCNPTCEACTPPEFPAATLKLMNRRSGTVEVCDHNCTCTACQEDLPGPVKITFWYKTDPAVLDINPDLSSLGEAIAYLSAANLQTSTCGCKIEKGFINDAQKAYTEVRINPVNGESVYNFEFGNLAGQLIFAERLSSAPKHRRPVRL